MKTMQTTFLLLIVSFFGCTSTHRLRPAQEADFTSLNNRAVVKRAMVTFVDGRKIQVENLRMTSDSSYWASTDRIATAQIKEVRFRSPGGGPRQYSLDNDADQTDLYENINQGTRGRNAVLILWDGQELQVRQLWVTSDFTYWIDPKIKQQASPKYVAVATSQIKDVRFTSRVKGTLQGWGFGFLLGTVVGLATGAPDEDCSGGNYGPCIDKTGWVLLLGAGGAALGLPIGAMRGHRDVYVIEQEATGTN